jgi:hypothetical protein
MGLTGCPEMLVRNYYYSLRNNPEKHSSEVLTARNVSCRKHKRSKRLVNAQITEIPKLNQLLKIGNEFSIL